MKIYKIKVNGKTYKVELEALEEIKTAGATTTVATKKEEPKKEAPKATGDGNEVVAPIQGTVCNVKVKVGDKVKKGDVLLLIEAMKLENEVVSPFEGTVSEISVAKGANVTTKQHLLTIK